LNNEIKCIGMINRDEWLDNNNIRIDKE